MISLKTRLVFYENNRKDVPTQHNRPFYITAKVRDVQLKSVLLDAGSSLIIIQLDVLDDIGVPSEKIQRQPFEISSFNGNRTYTNWFDKPRSPSRTNPSCTSLPCDKLSNVLSSFTRATLDHRYKALPSTYHQCLKAIWKGKKGLYKRYRANLVKE